MKKYVVTLGIEIFLSVLALSVLTMYVIVRSSGIGTFGASGDFANPGVIFYARDGSSYANFEISEETRREVYSAVVSGRRVEIGEKDFRADKTDLPDGGAVVTLSERIPVYRTVRVMLITAASVATLFFILALIFIHKKIERDITVPLKNLTESLKSVENGDYECRIREDGAGEIRELTRAAERLRLKLNDEVYKTERVEDDRKFLISSVSHDLRTPVAAVRGYLEGIRDDVADTEEKRRLYVKKAIDRLDAIKNMIEDLLLYSRLDSGGAEYHFVRAELAAYLADLSEEEAFIFSAENKTLEFKNEAGSAFVMIDPEKFARVIRNITQNAKKYIEPGTGRADVTLRHVRKNAVIEIRDNGEGMEPDEVTRIFDRFYRVSSARTSDGSTGLGLAISKRIVEDMGGKIWATSRKGEGTSFMISLKLAMEDENEENTDN